MFPVVLGEAVVGLGCWPWHGLAKFYRTFSSSTRGCEHLKSGRLLREVSHWKIPERTAGIFQVMKQIGSEDFPFEKSGVLIGFRRLGFLRSVSWSCLAWWFSWSFMQPWVAPCEGEVFLAWGAWTSPTRQALRCKWWPVAFGYFKWYSPEV